MRRVSIVDRDWSMPPSTVVHSCRRARPSRLPAAGGSSHRPGTRHAIDFISISAQRFTPVDGRPAGEVGHCGDQQTAMLRSLARVHARHFLRRVAAIGRRQARRSRHRHRTAQRSSNKADTGSLLGCDPDGSGFHHQRRSDLGWFPPKIPRPVRMHRAAGRLHAFVAHPGTAGDMVPGAKVRAPLRVCGTGAGGRGESHEWQSTEKPAKAGPSVTDQEALHSTAEGRPGKLEIMPTKPMATQRDLTLAYSPGRGRSGASHRRRSERSPTTTRRGQSRRGDHQRHGHSRPRQSRRARREAGDGRQGGPLQALRRCRFHRPRSRHPGRRRLHQLRCAISGRPSAASIWKTSRRRTASSSKAGCAS